MQTWGAASGYVRFFLFTFDEWALVSLRLHLHPAGLTPSKYTHWWIATTYVLLALRQPPCPRVRPFERCLSARLASVQVGCFQLVRQLVCGRPWEHFPTWKPVTRRREFRSCVWIAYLRQALRYERERLCSNSQVTTSDLFINCKYQFFFFLIYRYTALYLLFFFIRLSNIRQTSKKKLYFRDLFFKYYIKKLYMYVQLIYNNKQ